MNFKKFISGVSALTIAASAFAGMAVTANAAVVTTTTYNFSTTSPAAPTVSRWSASTITDPTDSTNQVAQLSAANNSGNGSGAYLYYDLSSLIPADVTSYTVSYRAYFPYTTDVRWSLGLADLTNFAFARYGYDATSVMIGSAGHFTDSYIRAVSGGNRSFVSDWENATRWVTVTDTVNVEAGTWTASIAGDSTYNTNGTLAEGAAYDKLLIYGYATNSNGNLGAVYLDDITITTTAPDPGAATAIAINYTSGGSTVTSTNIDISAAGKVSGDTSDTFYLPAYVTDASGNVYSTGLTDFHKEVLLLEGTTPVNVPVTAVAGLKNYFFEAEGHGGNADEAANAYAWSMGKGRRRLDQKAVTITVPEDGIYTVKTGLVCKSSSDTEVTITASSGATSFTITDTYYNAYRGSELSNTDITLKKDNTLSFTTTDWNMGLDYVLLTKTAEYPYAISKATTENGSFEVEATATAGTNVTITPTAASGYEVDTVSVATAAVTDNGNGTYSFTMPASDVTVSVTFKAVTPAGPTAEVEGISYQQFAAEATDAKADEDVTAAKVFVKTTGTVTRVGLSYNESAPQYAGDLTMTDATIVFGAIVPGLVNLQISNFTAVVE